MAPTYLGLLGLLGLLGPLEINAWDRSDSGFHGFWTYFRGAASQRLSTRGLQLPAAFAMVVLEGFFTCFCQDESTQEELAFIAEDS